MKKGFSIELFSDIEFEGMIVNINYGSERVAAINYDKGINQIEMKLIPDNGSTEGLIFSIDEFMEMLQKARELAIQCAREDQNREDEQF